MNILIIPSWYISKNIPNNGSFFREQALALQKSGNNVVILNGTFASRYDYFDSNNFRLRVECDEGMRVYSYVTPIFGISRCKKILNYIFYKRIEKLFKKAIQDGFKIDVIHAHSFMPAGYCASKLGEKYNIPVVTTEHASSVLNKKITNYENMCLKECIEKSVAFICVSEALKLSINELIKTKKDIYVLPNMVSSIFYYKELNRECHDFIFFSLGNLVKGKRFDLTINAFTNAFKGNENIKLFIGGTGHLSNTLSKLILDNGMSKQIKLLGVLSRKEVALRMQECNVFVLPSDYETFGVVYIEALASGKPIIGTRNGGAEKIINENNGIIVNTNDVVQLAESLKRVYMTYSNYDNKEISDQCLNKYGEKRYVNEMEYIFNIVILKNKESCLKNNGK